MSDTSIAYEPFGMDTFRREIIAELGEDFWRALTQGLELPEIATERDCGCRRMAAFMARLEAMADARTVQAILCRVRHGLRPSQSAWARQAFLEIGDLDEFLRRHREKEFAHFRELHCEKKDFYGDPITDEVLAFVLSHPALVAPVRRGDKLYCQAFPNNMGEYLKASDDRMKRYHACHCPFAKESILSGAPVSSALCSCSLGHVMNFVEAFLDRPLTGRVLGSVLHGDSACEYEIGLPADVMAAYVHEGAKA